MNQKSVIDCSSLTKLILTSNAFSANVKAEEREFWIRMDTEKLISVTLTTVEDEVLVKVTRFRDSN